MKMNLLLLILALTVFSVSQPSYSGTHSEVKIVFADEEGEKPTDEEPDCE